MSNVVSVPQEHPFRVQLEYPDFFQFEPLTPLPSWTDFSLNYSKLSSFYTLQASLQHGLLQVRYPLYSPVTCNFLIHVTESAPCSLLLNSKSRLLCRIDYLPSMEGVEARWCGGWFVVLLLRRHTTFFSHYRVAPCKLAPFKEAPSSCVSLKSTSLR